MSRPHPTTFRHVSPVQNVVLYSEEDPVTLVRKKNVVFGFFFFKKKKKKTMDPKLYYTLIPYTKHPDLKGDFAVFLHSKVGEPVPEIVELKEWAYGDQVESEWKVKNMESFN